MSNKDLKIGQRVAVVAKDVKGTVAYVGYPTFASGKWIGINLDEPKGKNNGTVRGHFYFECEENCGMFVRQTQLQLLDADDNPMETPMSASMEDVKPTAPNRRLSSITVAQRSRPTTSRTSLASSRQSLASFLSPSTERASTPDLTVKRASFVETGFVETLTPQFTPGQSMTSPQPNAAAVEEKLANLQAQQEITNLKAEVEDLKEKLETLRMRRSEDREKLRELERVRLQLDQANEFKAKIMESQAQLQRDLQRAKQEVREAQEALDLHNDETAELQEAAEMAALDKEMAEERAESIQMELEQCREKLEEATLDLQLMRAEMEASGNTQHPNAVSGGATGYEVRQLQQQNVRLKETLVRLRDLTAQDKHEMQKVLKDLDQYKSEIAELSRTKEKLSARVEELEAQVADLREQVDAALGAEEMVEQLAERKMALEDQVEQLKQDVQELEALQEVHEQLVESNRELEMDLREELEMAHAATRECAREREAALETIMDRDSTIVKFRELVQRMTEQYNELNAQINSKQGSSALESDQEQPSRSPPELGSLVQQSRASTRSIDLQLRALELSQARTRAEMLAACLPDHIMASGGDHDAILFILLLQRLNTKAEIILGQIRERFPAVNVWDREAITKSHTAVQYSFRCQLEYQLLMIQCMVSMWSGALEICTPEVLLRAASALPDAALQERALDGTAHLLKTNELDENCSLDGLERCWSYLAAMWSALNMGGVEGAACGRDVVLHSCAALDALARAAHSDVTALSHILQPSEQNMELGELHESIKTTCSSLQQQLKSIRRRLPPGVSLHNLPLDQKLVERLRGESASTFSRCARCVSLVARAACAAAATAGERAEPAPLSHATLQAIWGAASANVQLETQDDLGPAKAMKQLLSAVSSDVNKFAAFTQDKEYDVMSLTNVAQNKPTPPIVKRAQLVKKQLEETKTLTIRLEKKEAEYKELKKAAKGYKEELSEMNIRKELGEKKLTTAVRDAELKIDQLQRKLDDALNQIKRQEKEFDETLDHLQQDIESLEDERGALREKLKLYGKRGGSHHAVTSPVSSVREYSLSPAPAIKEAHEPSVKVSSGVPSGEVNEALQHQLKVLSWRVERERAARVEACARAQRAAVRSLRPLQNPASHAAMARRAAAGKLEAELSKLQAEWTLFVARSGLVKFPDEPSKYARALQQHKEKQKMIRSQLEERLSSLQAEARNLLSLHRPWRCVESDLVEFPSPELTAALSGKALDIGTIKYPAVGNAPSEDTIYVTPTQLAMLRELVTELKSDEVHLDLKPLDATVCAA
ncbi:dynactin subunit 1 isoform X2 [Leptidea sinapis]|uniref:dynactin subunit 1 isoform X2 n=1 Tax=Leptidea sinapis TaxID=189913 RepID=UPI00213CBB71|nr:dynactin subunit 1 isoform X2 [Leptidea sinapis]